MTNNVLLQKNGVTAFSLAITQMIIFPLKYAFWLPKLSTKTGTFKFKVLNRLHRRVQRAVFKVINHEGAADLLMSQPAVKQTSLHDSWLMGPI